MQVANLPKELQTKKVSSLPKELKSIAEELIAEKFGVEEEVVEQKAPNPFRDYEPGYGPPAFFDGPSMGRGWDERQRGYQDEIRVEMRPWDHLRIASLRIREPSCHSLIQAIRRFDMENMSRDRELIVNPDWFRHLLSNKEAQMYVERKTDRWVEGQKNVIARIFGCDVIATPQIMDARLEVRF